MINPDHPRYAAALEFLHDAVSSGPAGAIALTGPAGAGTSAVLAAFANQAPIAIAHGMPGNAHLVPFAAAARLLDALTGRREALNPAQELTARVPAFGALLTDLNQVLIAGINTGLYPIDEIAPYVDAAAGTIAEAIVDAAQQSGTRILAAGQIGWWDAASRRVLAQLAAAAHGAGLLVVIADDTDRAEVADWIDQLTGLEPAARHHTGGLDPDEVTTLAIDLGFALAPGAAARIADATGGHPIAIEVHLRRLAAGGHEDRPVLATVADAARDTWASLTRPEQRLLTAAAVAGHRFDTATITDIDDRVGAKAWTGLEALAKQTGLIFGGQPVGGDRGRSGYVWRHEAARDAVLGQVEARTLHARASRSLIAAAGGRQMPVETWIDICLHERAAGPAGSLGAAGSLLEAADLAYMALAFDECAQLAALAQEAAEAATGPEPQRQTHRAAAIAYRLMAADRPGHADPGGDDALAQAGEEAAAAAGKVRYRAGAALARSRTLQRTEGLDAQIAKLEQAHSLAAASGDATLPAAAAIAYARQLAKRDLPAGRALLAKTETFWYDKELTEEELLWYNLGQMYYGILSFDAGDFDTARQRLTSALVQASMTAPVQQPVAANFCAQLHFTIGDDDEATTALERALAAEAEHGVTTAWGAYNRALLAEHRARTGQDGALDLARKAWRQIQASGHPNLTPLVRGHLAETLYQAGTGEGELAEARALAEATIAETARTGQRRSTIIAHALWAAIATRRGDRPDATGHAETAVRLLDETGEQPAMRTEEILWRCAQAHAGPSSPDSEARSRHLIDRARTVIERKAASLADPDQRARYRGLPLNRRILNAGT